VEALRVTASLYEGGGPRFIHAQTIREQFYYNSLSPLIQKSIAQRVSAAI
jgi:hypothetical protein